MIARIDLLDAGDPVAAARAWSQTMRAAQDRRGFLGALLHRVYRRVNRGGYDLVSIARWSDLAAWHADRADPDAGPFGAQSKPGAHLYGRVDGTAGSGPPHAEGQILVTNPYRIAKADAAKNATMWNATKALMADREGFLDAELFQTFAPGEDEYFFVSRARWASEEAFLKQFGGRDYKELVAPYEGTFQICFSHLADSVAPAA